MVSDFSYLLPSIDTLELTEKRVKLTKEFCSEVPCYYFQGSLTQIGEYIPERLNDLTKK